MSSKKNPKTPTYELSWKYGNSCQQSSVFVWLRLGTH
jgi:hypothetical protein